MHQFGNSHWLTGLAAWPGRPAIVFGTLLVAAAGCRGPQWRDPDYPAAVQTLLGAPDRESAAEAPGPATTQPADQVAEELAGPHPVEDYIAYALVQNPAIQAARKRLQALANRVPQARSLDDPTMGLTLFPEQVETAAGQQQSVLVAAQPVPWPGKLRLRAEVAEAEADAARADLAATELQVTEQVKRAYYELYFLQHAIRITQQDLDLLRYLTDVADKRYRAGKVSQQDVLRAETETLDVENDLIRLRQRLAAAQARLAALLHVSPETELRALDQMPAEQLPGDIQRLYEQAVAARPELQAQLATLRSNQRRVELAELDYYPDATAGLTWINVADHGLSPVANGRDAFLISVGVNLPIYRERLEAAVREAEASTVASARRYEALRDDTLQQVKDLFEHVTSRQELVELFRDDIIPKADQTLQVSIRAYQADKVDFLQLIDNWRQLLRFQVAQYRLEAELRQSLAALERIVGGQLQAAPPGQAPRMPSKP